MSNIFSTRREFLFLFDLLSGFISGARVILACLPELESLMSTAQQTSFSLLIIVISKTFLSSYL